MKTHHDLPAITSVCNPIKLSALPAQPRPVIKWLFPHTSPNESLPGDPWTLYIQANSVTFKQHLSRHVIVICKRRIVLPSKSGSVAVLDEYSNIFVCSNIYYRIMDIRIRILKISVNEYIRIFVNFLKRYLNIFDIRIFKYFWWQKIKTTKKHVLRKTTNLKKEIIQIYSDNRI